MALASTPTSSSPFTSIQYRYKLQPWVVVLVAALFFFYEFIQMNMFNAIGPQLMETFKVSASDLGKLSAMYFYGNVLFLFISGILLDRYSTRFLLLGAISLCVICTFAFALATKLWQAEVCRFITGIASTYCMLSCVRLTSRWFLPHRMALVIGLVVTMAMLGGMYAQTPMTLLVEAFGWHHAVLINASIGIIFIVLIAVFVRDYPEGSQAQHQEELVQLKAMGFWASLAMAAKNAQNFLCGIYTCIMSFPAVILGAAWGSMYLIHVQGLSLEQSSYVTSMIFLGMIIGSPLMGWISDALRYRKLPMIIGSALTFGMSLVIMAFHLNLHQLMVAFFLLGFLAAAQVIAYPLVVESNPLSITNTAEGIACTIIMSAGLFQQVFGILVDWHWNGAMADGVRVYTAANFQLAYLMLPIAFFIAFIISCFVRETRCRYQHD